MAASAMRLAVRRINSEDGQSTLETALSAIAVLTLFIGVMEMCLALYAYHYVSEAAREGTRYAMVRGSSCSGFTSACPAQASDVQSYVRALGFPGIVPVNVTVTTIWPDTGSSCTPSSLPCNNPGNLVQVTVQYSFPLSIPFVPSKILPLTSTSKMAISQ
ncbi:MAG: pilus assembly protein [Terracidiphilus sp.]|nr:pilus assembly protein [Terracidiphilus sp.]